MTTAKATSMAVVGIPNVGKSLIFNRLTGGRAWVGNWPGVTVEKKVGRLKIGGTEVEVVDLPGIYSLTPYSVDELIARNFIVEERPEVVVCIASAANLERSLYLAISLLELGANVVLDLNMIDLAEGEGLRVDHAKLGDLLGIPVVPTIATTGYGVDELRRAIGDALREGRGNVRVVDYGDEVEGAIAELESLIERQIPELADKYPARWLAIKLLEGDNEVLSMVGERPGGGGRVGQGAEPQKRAGEERRGSRDLYD